MLLQVCHPNDLLFIFAATHSRKKSTDDTTINLLLALHAKESHTPACDDKYSAAALCGVTCAKPASAARSPRRRAFSAGK